MRNVKAPRLGAVHPVPLHDAVPGEVADAALAVLGGVPAPGEEVRVAARQEAVEVAVAHAVAGADAVCRQPQPQPHPNPNPNPNSILTTES